MSKSSSSGSFMILRKKVSETDKLSPNEQLRDKRIGTCSYWQRNDCQIGLGDHMREYVICY
jgi:hypothetical protein